MSSFVTGVPLLPSSRSPSSAKTTNHTTATTTDEGSTVREVAPQQTVVITVYPIEHNSLQSADLLAAHSTPLPETDATGGVLNRHTTNTITTNPLGITDAKSTSIHLSAGGGIAELPSFNSISTHPLQNNTPNMRQANVSSYQQQRTSPTLAATNAKNSKYNDNNSGGDPMSMLCRFFKVTLLRGNTIDIIPIAIAAGFSLASYAYYVEYRLEESKQLGSKYTAACDIGIFSCTKVFSSEFGYLSQFFGLPKISNALVGMLFYAFLFFLHFLTTLPSLSKKSAASGKPFWPTVFSLQPEPRGVLLSALALFGVLGALTSCMLFYILTIKLHDLCIVCCSIYVVNFTLLATTVPRYLRYVKRRAKESPLLASPILTNVGGGGTAADRWV